MHAEMSVNSLYFILIDIGIRVFVFVCVSRMSIGPNVAAPCQAAFAF
jgi:hypothetical protein